jgi:hypothetical protein
MAFGLSASPAEGKRGVRADRAWARAAQLQPNESAPSSWLHFVETRPLVGQPELFFMHVQRSEAADDAHAVGIFLHEPAVQALVALSYESAQYSPVAAHVAVPHLAPVVVGGVVVELPGQSDANPVEFEI